MKIFLDDVRRPSDCITYMNNVLYADPDWLIARNYDQFVELIRGIKDPRKIKAFSFDHDLADEHYSPLETSQIYEEMKANPELVDKFYRENFKERTGYDCAMWLDREFYSYGIKLPLILVHSMNPVGKQNIKNVFNLK